MNLESYDGSQKTYMLPPFATNKNELSIVCFKAKVLINGSESLQFQAAI